MGCCTSVPRCAMLPSSFSQNAPIAALHAAIRVDDAQAAVAALQHARGGDGGWEGARVRRMLRAAPPGLDEGGTALHLAAFHDSGKAAEALLRLRLPDVLDAAQLCAVCDAAGNTPIHIATARCAVGFLRAVVLFFLPLADAFDDAFPRLPPLAAAAASSSGTSASPSQSSTGSAAAPRTAAEGSALLATRHAVAALRESSCSRGGTAAADLAASRLLCDALGGVNHDGLTTFAVCDYLADVWGEEEEEEWGQQRRRAADVGTPTEAVHYRSYHRLPGNLGRLGVRRAPRLGPVVARCVRSYLNVLLALAHHHPLQLTPLGLAVLEDPARHVGIFPPFALDEALARHMDALPARLEAARSSAGEQGAASGGRGGGGAHRVVAAVVDGAGAGAHMVTAQPPTALRRSEVAGEDGAFDFDLTSAVASLSFSCTSPCSSAPPLAISTTRRDPSARATSPNCCAATATAAAALVDAVFYGIHVLRRTALASSEAAALEILQKLLFPLEARVARLEAIVARPKGARRFIRDVAFRATLSPRVLVDPITVRLRAHRGGSCGALSISTQSGARCGSGRTTPISNDALLLRSHARPPSHRTLDLSTATSAQGDAAATTTTPTAVAAVRSLEAQCSCIVSPSGGGSGSGRSTRQPPPPPPPPLLVASARERGDASDSTCSNANDDDDVNSDDDDAEEGGGGERAAEQLLPFITNLLDGTQGSGTLTSMTTSTMLGTDRWMSVLDALGVAAPAAVLEDRVLNPVLPVASSSGSSTGPDRGQQQQQSQQQQQRGTVLDHERGSSCFTSQASITYTAPPALAAAAANCVAVLEELLRLGGTNQLFTLTDARGDTVLHAAVRGLRMSGSAAALDFLCDAHSAAVQELCFRTNDDGLRPGEVDTSLTPWHSRSSYSGSSALTLDIAGRDESVRAGAPHEDEPAVRAPLVGGDGGGGELSFCPSAHFIRARGSSTAVAEAGPARGSLQAMGGDDVSSVLRENPLLKPPLLRESPQWRRRTKPVAPLTQQHQIFLKL